jgi:ribosomal protein L37AE/L43A
MSDRLEAAASGRAQCRACGAKIEKGALRFGAELPSAYGDGEASSVYWFHPRCAALRQPERFATLLRQGAAEPVLPDAEALLAEADQGVTYPKLARLAGAEKASSGRARCRQCREPIAGGAWRFKLSNFEQSGFFEPLGFVHTGCALPYFEIPELSLLRERVRHTSPDLDPAALEEILNPTGEAMGAR